MGPTLHYSSLLRPPAEAPKHSDQLSDVTFTGDAIRLQLVAHKARADHLVPGVTALLFTGTATCNQSPREQVKRLSDLQRPSQGARTQKTGSLLQPVVVLGTLPSLDSGLLWGY